MAIGHRVGGRGGGGGGRVSEDFGGVTFKCTYSLHPNPLPPPPPGPLCSVVSDDLSSIRSH